jgi:hypothetical protein
MGDGMAVNSASVHETVTLLDRLRPDVFKLDAREPGDETAAADFLNLCAAAHIGVVFKRLDSPRALEALRRIGARRGNRCMPRVICLASPAPACCRPGRAPRRWRRAA